MLSFNPISFTDAIIGSADAHKMDNTRSSHLRGKILPKLPRALSLFSWAKARTSWGMPDVGTPRSVFPCMTVFIPSVAAGRAGVEMTIRSLGRHKVVEIRRRDPSEDVMRVKMYESTAQLTVCVPTDFHGVVSRVGHSGRSISLSRSALYLKESNNLRFNCPANVTEDFVRVRTEKVLHVCVEGDLPMTRMARYNSDWDCAPVH